MNRYRVICPIFVRMATKASRTDEGYKLAIACANELGSKLNQIMEVTAPSLCTSGSSRASQGENNGKDVLIRAKNLKKKDGIHRRKKRIKSSLEVDSKRKKVRGKKSNSVNKDSTFNDERGQFDNINHLCQDSASLGNIFYYPNFSALQSMPNMLIFTFNGISVLHSNDDGFSSKTLRSPLKLNEHESGALTNSRNSYGVIEARKGNPPIMPAVMTPGGPLDLSTVLFRNRIIFIGQPITSAVAQRVITQLVTLATIDENSDILVYLNCPGGSTYSVLAIYDCMSWIKPKVGTVCFGVAASQGALLLAGGEKGMRYAMPNARIMIHQPQSGCGGHVEDVRRQVNEAVQSRHKIDMMYAAFTGQPIEKVQQYTERDRFLSVSEAMEFGLIDGVLETEY